MAATEILEERLGNGKPIKVDIEIDPNKVTIIPIGTSIDSIELEPGDEFVVQGSGHKPDVYLGVNSQGILGTNYLPNRRTNMTVYYADEKGRVDGSCYSYQD